MTVECAPAPPLDAAPPETSRDVVRVLHLINGEHYSGAERVQDLLALRLPEQGYEVGFVCLKPDRFPGLRRAVGAPVYQLPMRARFDLRPLRELARIITGEGYRLLHSHTPRAALVGGMAAWRTGRPLVHHIHSPTTVDSERALRNWFNAAVERASLLRAAAVITVSSSLAGYAERAGVPRRLVTVVPNGVPTAGELAPREAPAGGWTLGCVALFRPRKGLEVLLTALAELRKGGLDVRLRAVGGFETHEYRARIERLSRDLGLEQAIDWRGFVVDVAAELAAIDLFVLPSLYGEGLPMVVLEAMAAGTPIVATRVEGVPEAIRDGVDGLLAAAGDPVDLAAVVRRLIEGDVDWRALRRAAHARQAERFSDRSMAAGVAQVYNGVLHR